MDTRIRTRSIVLASALALGLLATGCAANGMPEPSGSAAPVSPSESSPSSSGEPSADTFAYPDPSDPTQVAISMKYDGTDPSGEVIAGPALLIAERPFSVEAQCEGESASFEVVTTDAEQRVLVEGDIDCADPPSGESTYRVSYDGAVQVNLTDADDVGRAWVRVIQP